MNPKRTTTALLLLASLSVGAGVHAEIGPANGFYTAKVGAICTTQPNAFGGAYTDVVLAWAMIGANDWAAFHLMEKAERISTLKAGAAVQVIKRLDDTIQVRPIGLTSTFWMVSVLVECPQEERP